MMEKQILRLIKTRRSIRKFKKESVGADFIKQVLEAGRWAPSGLNNQPWKFMVLQKELKDRLSDFTRYGRVVRSADTLILVFLHKKISITTKRTFLPWELVYRTCLFLFIPTITGPVGWEKY